MEQERDEVYERIPWEMLERKSADRQWLVYAVAGAVVLGALAYSFTRNQPAAPIEPAAEQPAISTVPATTASTAAAPTPSTVASPVVVAEADLYAVDPERLIDQAAAHAEWFAVEYVSFDGSVESGQVLEGLLPVGMPIPEGPQGTQVFVDWAGAANVVQTGPMAFEVDVIVRSLVAQDGSAFVRQPPLRVTVPIDLDDEGRPRVARPPAVAAADSIRSTETGFESVPEDVAAALDVEGDVVGGFRDASGGWLVVVMSRSADGVTRPVTVSP